MSEPLPPLRPELDIFPSQDPERPGFVLRDPLQYVDVLAFVPPALAQALPLFDGEHTREDVVLHLTRLTGEIEIGEVVDSFIGGLSSAGFLQTPEFEKRKEERRREFAERAVREPAHAGTGYPEDADELRSFLDDYATQSPPGGDSSRRLSAIAAPHVSPDGGWRSYARAYQPLDASYANRTFVILGTSHYGEPEKFGLTRKGFRTPFGLAGVDVDSVERLQRAAPDSVVMEDYCHRIEHSIEFQVVYLQRAVGPDVRILPILCGPFWDALLSGSRPESTPGVGRFLDALGRLAEDTPELFWILGVDLSHIGSRYGDAVPAIAETGHLTDVRTRDHARIERLSVGDTGGFFDLVHPNQDDLRWCGFSPLYAYAYSRPQARPELWSYEQWNIDPQSVVSFAAMGYYE